MQHLLLLHGAIGSSAQMEPLAKLLEPHFKVHMMDFPGHGGHEVPESFSISLFTDSVLQFLKERSINKAFIFGYSMGGYIALKLATMHPEIVEKAITLATKFKWSPEIAAKENRMLQPQEIEGRFPAFAAALKHRHSEEYWSLVLQRTAEMLSTLGQQGGFSAEDYQKISIPCLLTVGDRDKMVSIEETIDAFRQIPGSEFAVLPGTPHPFEQVDYAAAGTIITNFLMKRGSQGL